MRPFKTLQRSILRNTAFSHLALLPRQDTERDLTSDDLNILNSLAQTETAKLPKA